MFETEPAVQAVENTLYVIPTNALIIGFAVVVVLLIIILAAVVRRPAATAAPRAAEGALAPSAAPIGYAGGYAGADGQVVAAIAAAIAALGEREGVRLVVRSVRRTGDGWASAGRRKRSIKERKAGGACATPSRFNGKTGKTGFSPAGFPTTRSRSENFTDQSPAGAGRAYILKEEFPCVSFR